MESLTSQLSTPRITRPVIVLLLLISGVWLTLAISSAWRKSGTVDEFPHIGAGVSYWAFGDFRMNPEHPPLVKLLSAIPILLFDAPDLRVEREGTYVGAWFDGLQNEWGWYLLYYDSADPMRRLMLARAAPILIGLLGGWLVFFWGRALSNSCGGGVAAMVLLLFYPEYLGHARFVTFDVPTAVSIAAVGLVSLNYLRRPGWRAGAWFVGTAMVVSQVKLPVSIGVAAACFTLLALAPLTRGRMPVRGVLLLTAATIIGGVFACWASAGFRFAHLPEGVELRAPSAYIPDGTEDGDFLNSVIAFCWNNRLLPEATLATLKHLNSFQVRHMYLFGEWRLEGWYDYFLATFALKTPLPMIAGFLLLLAGTAWRWRRLRGVRGAWRLQQAAVLLVPTLVLLLLTSWSRANLGHRYILFVYVAISAWIGAWAWRWFAAGGWRRWLGAGLVLSQLVTAAVTWPHYATYFHALVGTPYEGNRYLSDSNVDWGQDLPALKAVLDEAGNPPVNYAVFGHNRPERFGVREYRWILEGYPYAIQMPAAVAPDLRLPLVVSLNNLQYVRGEFPGHYDRDPDLYLNSIVIFMPEPAGPAAP